MRRFLLLFNLVIFTAFGMHAQIGSVAGNNWSTIGNTQIVIIYTDGDNGDGIGDGAQKLNNTAAGPGHGVLYQFNGTMTQGTALNFETYVFNPNASYVSLKIELFNATDNIILTDSGNLFLTFGVVQNVVLNYNPTAMDDGDVLQVRYRRIDDGHPARAFAIDNAQLDGRYLFPEATVEPSCFDQTGQERGWDKLGDVQLTRKTNDAHNGDGLNDGGLSVVSNTPVGDQGHGASYIFDCAMSSQQLLKIEAFFYNDRNSYAGAKLQLYNLTDQRIMGTSNSIFIPAQSTSLGEFSLVTDNMDAGDQLQFRVLRADDGILARSFHIDWATINGTYLNASIIPPPLNPVCTQGPAVTPDIPLGPVLAEEALETEKVYNALKAKYLGTGVGGNFQSEMNNALSRYNDLEIQLYDDEVFGKNTSFNEASSILRTFARHLNFVDPNDADVAERASNLVALVAQQFCRGTISRDGNAYVFREFARPIMYLKDHLPDAVKDQFGYVLSEQTDGFYNFWGTYQEGQGYNTDHIYNMGDQLVLYGIFRYPNNDEEKVRHLKAAKRYVERFLTHSNGTSDGIKPDGTGFHHATANDTYMYAYTTVINLIEAFDDTRFQIGERYYYAMRDALLAQKMFSNDARMRALSMTGRGPIGRYVTTGHNQVRQLAISGGKLLGLATADPILAGYHNRVWGTVPAFNYTTAAPFESGYLQLNHAHAGVFRKDGWLAVFKGFSNNMWGAEIYTTSNRYGRYQSYGALEVLYPGGPERTGNGYDHETWNWNYNPGTTTIVLPWDKLHAEKGRIDELQQKRFVGSLSFKNKGNAYGALKKTYGTYGMFAMDFRESGGGFGVTHGPNTHNTSFTFKKSNFAFRDAIVCLGSDIANDDTDNPTVTTLYQRVADVTSEVNVNANLHSDGEFAFSGLQDNWMIDDYDTGFYIVSGSGELKIRKGDQQTPNQNETDPSSYTDNAIGAYTLGYIDHGAQPSDAGYEYVIVPNASQPQMQGIAAKKPYTVMERSSERHVVRHDGDKIWGYALFGTSDDLGHGDGLVKANNAPCLLMYQELDEDRVQMAVTDPDLGFDYRSANPARTSRIMITLYGRWILDQANPEVVNLGYADGGTRFEITVDDAMPVEFFLKKEIYAESLALVPGDPFTLEIDGEKTLEVELSPSNITAQELVWRSNDPTVATVDGNGTVTGIAEGTASITVSDTFSGLSDSVDVTVVSTEVLAEGIEILPGSPQSVVENGQIELEAVPTPLDVSTVNLVWQSNDPTVATVDDNGTVSGVAQGIAVITVTDTQTGLSDSVDVTVVSTEVLAEGIEILPGSPQSVVENGQIELEAVPTPLDVSTVNLVWQSNDPTVATVDDNGTVSGVAQGIAVITVTDTQTGLSDSVDVTVEQPTQPEVYVDSIVLVPRHAFELFVEEAIELTVQLSPSNVTSQNLVWQSSDTTVAIVNENGIVTGINPGISTLMVTDLISGNTDSVRVLIKPLSDKASSITYYPNPVTTHLTIESEKRITICEIYDMHGKVIVRIQPLQKEIKIALQHLNPGPYIITLYDSSGSNFFKLFLKE